MYIRSRRVALLIAATGLATACGDAPVADPSTQAAELRGAPSRYADSEPLAVGARSGSTRLMEWPGEASIHSPLQDIRAASRTEIGDMPSTVLLSEDFEEFDAERVHWPTSKTAIIVEDEGDRALAVRIHQREEVRRWIVPAEPNTHYVFERSVRCESQLDADFVVLEATDTDSVHDDSGDRHDMGLGAATVRMHRAPIPAPDSGWQRTSVSLFTTPQTHALGIVLRTTDERRAELARWGNRPNHRAWFDDISLRRVDPTREQAIALLKGAAMAEGADATLGIAKHGQFPPLAEVTSAHGPEEDNFSHRYALYAPPPTDLRFFVECQQDTRLFFSACVSRESLPGHAARFEVLARTETDETVLWSKELTAGDDWSWHDAIVDLTDRTGTSFELVLRTVATAGWPHPMWGSPVLDVAPGGDELRNVILIAVDTLRADRLSCYGYEQNTSPRIDALARDGVRFENVSSNGTWTCPSFASIFTGVVPSRHGVWAFSNTTPLPPHFDTLAERFRSHGWATQSVIYKAPLYNGGYEQGFDVAFNVPRTMVAADDNLAEAMEWLERNENRRNFLFLHFDDPHQPFTQPPPFDTKYGDPGRGDISLPISFEADPPKQRELRQIASELYDGEIAYVDDRIGAFLDELKKRDLYDNAVIAFVSDHGEEFWEHGRLGHGGDKLHDEVVRVPLIVKPGAGEFARDRVIGAQVRGFDVMPTLLDLAGIGHEDDLDAETLIPFLGPLAPTAANRVAVTETKQGGAALRTPKWKYILKYWRRTSEEMLFDLTADPGEQDNLIRERPLVAQRLRHALLDYFMRHRPGYYLVAIQPRTKAFEFRLQRSTSPVVSFVGPSPEFVDGAWRFEGRTRTGLAAVAEFDAGEDIVLDGDTYRTADFPRYQAGDLERLMRAGAPVLALFSGPPPQKRVEVDENMVDLQQIEALRALGYTGAGGAGEEK